MEKNDKFEQYYKEIYSQALLYTIKKVQNKDEAEDLVMNTFFVCYTKFELFDSKKASFATWFYCILNNRIKNYYRDTKSAEDIDMVEVKDDSFEAEFIEAMDLAKTRNQLAGALLCLKESQRQLVILKYFKEKKTNEIASILGISPGNVRIQLMRSLNKMKTFLEENNYDWEN